MPLSLSLSSCFWYCKVIVHLFLLGMCIVINSDKYRVTPPKKQPINFFISTKKSKIILILYTRTSGLVGEYYGPNFSCTESTSYPEKMKRLELNLWISVKNMWVLFFFFGGGVTLYVSHSLHVSLSLNLWFSLSLWPFFPLLLFFFIVRIYFIYFCWLYVLLVHKNLK